MKLYNISLAVLLGIGTLTSCESKLDVTNPNQQTAATFGFSAEDLEENVIAAYNHIRMEGTYARVGYMLDVCRGDEVLHHQRNKLHSFSFERRQQYPHRAAEAHQGTDVVPPRFGLL